MSGEPWKDDDGLDLARGGPDRAADHEVVQTSAGNVKCSRCEKRATSEGALQRTPCDPQS